LSCNSCDKNPNGQDPIDVDRFKALVTIGEFQLDSGNYSPNETVIIPQVQLTNEHDFPVKIQSITFSIRHLSFRQPTSFHEIIIALDTLIDGRTKLEVPPFNLWTIAGNASGPYGVYSNVIYESLDSLQYGLPESTVSSFHTFFRVSNFPERNTFTIDTGQFNGLPIYILKRGLSAEYSVQKTAASLSGGISHSWDTPLTYVRSTPQFLEKSVQKTVDFYNGSFGQNYEFETVVISTGIPSAIYLANSLQAPILPLHFLVGAETVKEVEAILKYSNASGYKSYAAFGHDYSISTNVGVAWIKLLDLPNEYQQFIQDHNVQKIVFLGYEGLSGGELQAKKIMDNSSKYGPGSIYIMHFAGANSTNYLNATIKDLEEYDYEEMNKIADWESGIITAQIENFSSSIHNQTQVEEILYVRSKSDVALWDLGSYLMLSYLKKNEGFFPMKTPLKGFSLNPYLTGHPFFETMMGYVPLLYWQAASTDNYINNTLLKNIKVAVNHYFPDVELNEMKFWVNSSRNFGGKAHGIQMAESLRNKSFNEIIVNDFDFDEIWFVSNGMNSASETRAELLLNTFSLKQITSSVKQFLPLGKSELLEICELDDRISLLSK